MYGLKVKGHSLIIWVGPNSSDTSLGDEKTPKRSPCEVEAGTGAMLPQMKKCLEPPEAQRGQEESHPYGSKGMWPCRQPDTSPGTRISDCWPPD